MPRISGSVVLAANVKSVNQMADKLNRFIPRGARIRLLCTGSVAAERCNLTVGGVTLVDDSEISSANRFPLESDDVYLPWTIAPGGEIILTFIGAAGTVKWALDLA